jgi:hypothetical protein
MVERSRNFGAHSDGDQAARHGRFCVARPVRAGVVEAAAMRSRWNDGVHPDSDEPVLIPRFHWTFFPEFQTGPELAFWQTGDIRFEMDEFTDTLNRTSVRYFGVRFEPKGIEEMIASAAPPVSLEPPDTPQVQPLANPSKGGRPRKEFWDDFWIEICGRIYEGDLKPKTQADLERAMIEWVENRGYEVGETTIKAAARKLFNAWKLGVKN